MRRVHLRISGRVQGVFFRQSTRREATRLGVRGWVKNLAGGDVDAVAIGDQAALDALVEWCGHGPTGARVTNVQTEWGDANADEEAMTAFIVRH